MTRGILFGLLIGLVLAPSIAKASCDGVVVEVSGGRTSLNYDPFAASSEAALPLRVVGGACADGVEVAVRPVGALQVSGRDFVSSEGFRFNILDGGRRLLDGGASSRLATSGAGGAPANFLTIQAPRGQMLPVGDYIIEALLQTRVKGVVSERRFAIDLRVSPSVRLAASQSVLDLATLESGEEKSFSLSAFANTGYRLSFSSQNSWKLKRDGAEDGETGVGYVLNVLGEARPAGLRRAAPRSGIDVIGAKIAVGDVSSSVAGSYRDVVTINITPDL